MSKTWTASVSVSQTWIDDGFELTPDRLHSMLQSELGYATTSEIAVSVDGVASEYNTGDVDDGYTEE
ncbi:MAG: hypothetical protein ACYTEQ_00875 [Planctomycetota bacterium]